MTSLKTPQQLATAIEVLIAAHLDDVRRAAQHAIDRSFSNAAPATKTANRNLSTI